MNACPDTLPDDRASIDVRSACEEIFASPAFAHAPRMCQLLAFLVDKKLTGREGEVSEYAIGLEVFERDARTYDTTADPLVRVQMGRLRERLALYYASLDKPPTVRILIPLGKYLPVIRQLAPAVAGPGRDTLELKPLIALEHDGAHAVFVRGLDDELKSRLFAALGGALRLHEASVAYAQPDDCPHAFQRMEGSIRVEHEHVRASVRLVDGDHGHIRWVSQFDCRGKLGMAMQEQLAGAICTGIRDHLRDPASRASS